MFGITSSQVRRSQPTCQVKNPLNRFTPLVRTKMSSGGLPASEVDRWEVMESSVIELSGVHPESEIDRTGADLILPEDGASVLTCRLNRRCRGLLE